MGVGGLTNRIIGNILLGKLSYLITFQEQIWMQG